MVHLSGFKLLSPVKSLSLSGQVTQCGELCDRVDLASQVYTKGSHLLCHDDVIGTRKASRFIVVLELCG